MDVESLSSMVEQPVKKMIGRKTKEVNGHMADSALERSRGVTFAYAIPVARPY